MAFVVIGAGVGRAQQPAFAAACSALPAVRPPGLVLRHAIHDYRAPEALRRFVFFEASLACPADEMPGYLLTTYAPRVCVPLEAAVLDALYARLIADRLPAIRVRTALPAAHSAGAELTLLWAGHACRVGNVLHALDMHPDDVELFARIDASLRARE